MRVSGEELVGGSGRVLVVSHVQEIVQQDYEHLNLLLPNCVGIFSAGLKRRDVSEKVIVAGIQSVWRSTRVGRFDMLVVDECHLLPPHETSMYRTLLKRLREDNPDLVLVGLTATPFRTDGGNVRRHGTIDDLYIPDYEEIKKSREERKLSTNSRFSEPFGYSDEIECDTNSDVTKICPECKEIVRTHVKTCPDCGFDFVADEERKAKEEEERKAKQAEEERRANEEMKRLEEEEEECAKTEWERKRKENPKAWGKAKREARWEAMRVMNTIYCGNVTGIFIKKHVAQYSGRVSLQIIFGMRQEVTYEFGGNTYQDNVCICAFLWLHFNNVGRDLLSRGREWWEKLTGLKGMFPKDVEEAFEMRGLIVKPVTASYQVLSGRDGFYNSVSDVSYGEQGHPGTDGKLYREFNKERSLRRANELLKHYKVLKTKVKRSMKSAEQEYEQAIANAVARYNAVMEMSQSDYDTALKLKQEADELTAVYANADKVIETALSDDAPF